MVDLVSNTSKPYGGVIAGRPAQSFRTGANVLGYTLSGIRFYVGYSGSVTFKIREDVGGSPGGSELATLSGNMNRSGLYTLTAPAGVTLNPNTTYWVVSENSSSPLHVTSDDGETGLTGWTLGNVFKIFSNNRWRTDSAGKSFRIAVRGYANLPTTIKLIHTYVDDRDATAEGSPVPVVVVASKCPPLVGGHGLTIPLKMTTSPGQTAEIGEDVPATFTIGVCHAFGSPAWYRRSSTVAYVPTYQDGDSDDETFTISLDLDKLPADIAPDPSWAAVAATIRDDDRGGRGGTSQSGCTQRLSGDGSVTGRWAAGCNSSERSGRYARYYEFTLSERREVTLYLQSSTDPYLYLRSGAQQRSGRAVAYDDDGGRGYDSRIRRTLEAGTYTIEATTFNPGTGTFTLTLFGTGGAASSPSQSPAEETSSSSSQTPSQPSELPAPSQTTPAPTPELRVSDAQAEEGGPYNPGLMVFTVTLSPPAAHEVTVGYGTRDGTARGDLYGRYGDYTETSGQLRFAAGETSKTVTVDLIGDWHDEGPETFFLDLFHPSPQGVGIADGEGVGTIINDDPIPAAWISRFGRTVAAQVLDAVDARMGSQPAPGVAMTIAGQPVQWPDGSDESQPVAAQVVEQLAQWVSVSGNGAVALRTLHENDLLANSSFALASPSGSGGLFSFWGRGAVSNFDGRDGELSLDGEVTTWLLGTDWSWGQWQGTDAKRTTAGLLLSRSTAHGGYGGGDTSGDVADGGDVRTTLTGVFPWARHRFTERLEAWAAAGFGQGDLEVTPKPTTGEDGATLSTDLNLWLAAAGLRGTLLDGGNDGFTLTGKTDVMAVGTSSGAITGENGNLAAAEATVTRLRLGLEAQRPFSFGKAESDARATLTPSVEMGLRLDGGDAETGFGLDLGGGITLSHPARGLQAEVRGRGLLTHAAEGFRDQGFSGSLSWQQQPASDLGAALSLTQTMGGSSSGGADALLSRVNLEGLAANDDGSNNNLKNQRLELQFSYGFLAFGGRFTLTPEVGLSLYDSGRDYRVGWSLARPEDGEPFALSFGVTRQESASNDGIALGHGVELNLDTRF